MSKIDIDVNEQNILNKLVDLMKADPDPVNVAVNSQADRIIVKVLKKDLEQDSEWRRSLMRTAQDALKGVPSAIAFLKDKDSYLWMRALSDYLDEGGQL